MPSLSCKVQCQRSENSFMMQRRGMKLLSSVVISRHGDRTPVFNFFHPHSNSEVDKVDEGKDGGGAFGHQEDERARQERLLWAEKVAEEQDLARLRERFPVAMVCGNNAEVVKKGMLDERKVVKMEHKGPVLEKPFGRTTKLGLRQLFDNGVALRERYSNENIDWKNDVLVFSTNYTRTQESAQSLLSGLLGEEGTRHYIHVTTSDVDVANSWAAKESLRNAIRDSSHKDPFFHDQEKTYAAARKTLIENLPVYRSNPQGFMWVYSLDYFVCRESHNLPIDDVLAPCRPDACQITINRFIRWYSDPVIADMAAGDLLRAIRGHMHNARDPVDGKRFILYSGHDITILPLLVAVGARKGLGLDFDKNWPHYGSYLVFEQLQDDTDFYVRVLYKDEEIVPPCHFDEFWSEKLSFNLDHSSL